MITGAWLNELNEGILKMVQDAQSKVMFSRQFPAAPGQNIVVKIGSDQFRHQVAPNSKSVVVEIVDETQTKERYDSPATDGMKTR